ncbi:MAG: noncanonical pyrimidine nucleotidase, YjjG family [Ruminococcaceae bacterium]|nr:noncanonical pyrimidine nucleotidase, YjjG family [Oscillospiraceae bacterium]
MRYTTLLMDADETLLDFCRSEGFALSDTMEKHGITMTPEIQHTYHEINRLLWQQLERGEIVRSRLKVQRFEELFEAIGASHIDAASFNEQYMQTLGTRGFVLDGAVGLVKALSEHYRICIITNGTASVQHTRLADSGLLPYINGVFISQEIGADKPSVAFFDAVLAALGHPDKSELLIIGDSLTSDIRGGLLSGIDTCWFAPNGGEPPSDIAPLYTVRSYDELLSMLLA